MMVMTAKLNLKKILLILGTAAAVVLSLILVLGGDPAPGHGEAAPAPVSGNEARVKFLRDLGWEVTEEPTQSGPVRVPRETSQIYERYNNLQKSQGYDLSTYAGKKVMRYVYEIRNYPGATAPVYATVLISGDSIIGGDITDTSAGGKIRGFQRLNTDPSQLSRPAPSEPEPRQSLPAPDSSQATEGPALQEG